jgi:hypothetical protein
MPEFVLPRGDRKRALPKAVAVLESLDEESAWRVTIEPARATRSHAQNNYLWAVANKMISDATGYEPEEVHEYLCGQHFGWKDKRVPKTPRNPDGVESVPRRTTTRNEQGKRNVLTTTEFAAYVDFVQRFAAKKLSLFIPDPDPGYARERAA